MPFLLPVVFHVLAHRQPAGRDLPPGVAEPRPPGDPGAAVWAGGVAAVACVVLVALLVTGLVTRGDGGPARAGQRPVAAASAGTVVRSLTVDGRDPLWTDTGLSVRPGDRVDISAFGLVRPSRRPGYHAVPPGGLTTPHPGQLSIAGRVNHEALVATIGEASTPGALGRTSPARVLAVGADRTLAIRKSGELFLGVNDKLTADNSGWFGATVTLRHRR